MSSCALRCAWDPRRDACGVAQHAVTGDLRQEGCVYGAWGVGHVGSLKNGFVAPSLLVA